MPSSQIYTLSLHDALPILLGYMPGWAGLGMDLPQDAFLQWAGWVMKERYLFGDSTLEARANFHNYKGPLRALCFVDDPWATRTDRKSTRLNSSHRTISYAVLSDLHSFPTRRSSDLVGLHAGLGRPRHGPAAGRFPAMGGLGDEGTLSVRRLHARGSREFPQLQGPPARALLRRRPLGNAHRSEEHTSELQSPYDLVCRPLRSTLFPYTTLFRSCWATCRAGPASAWTCRRTLSCNGRAG